MPSALPTENTLSKAVDTFGIGTYDSQRDEDGDHGENSEAHEPGGRSLPDDGTKSPQTNDPEEWLSYPNDQESRTVTNIVSADQQQQQDEEDEEESWQGKDVFSPDRALAYPDSPDARLGSYTMWRGGFVASADLPGDMDGNFQHFHPNMDNIDARAESVAQGSILPQEEGVDGRDPGAMGRRKNKKTSDIHHSELPNDGDNPSARSDYYDTMMPGHAGSTRKSFTSDYLAPTEDMGAYAGESKDSENSELPVPMKNDETMDDWLQSLGNFWSGKEIEDLSNPQGFPTTDFSENADYDRSDNQDGGTIVPLGDDRMFAMDQSEFNKKMEEAQKIKDESRRSDTVAKLYEEMAKDAKGTAREIKREKTAMQRNATNINQVVALTKDFLKEAGKKGLTKRHVLAFLQQRGLPQYLSSDVIRCLKLSHDIHVKDVLDEFPVYREASMNRYAEEKKCESCDSKLDSQGLCPDHDCPNHKYTFTPNDAKKKSAASQTSIARARYALINLECKHVLQPEIASVLRRCAANLTRTIIDLENLETGRVRKADGMDGAIKCHDSHVKESTKTAYDEYCNSCKVSGQSCMSHDEWLHGLKQHEARMAGIHKTQNCGTCKHYAWDSRMMPARVGGEWHHPACIIIR